MYVCETHGEGTDLYFKVKVVSWREIFKMQHRQQHRLAITLQALTALCRFYLEVKGDTEKGETLLTLCLEGNMQV